MLDGCSLQKEQNTGNGTAAGSLPPATDISDASKTLSDYFPEGYNSSDFSIYLEAMASLFKLLISLPRLRRAAGPQGQLESVPLATWQGQSGRPSASNNVERMYMTSDCSSFWPVPTTMKVVWDVD